MKRSLLVLIAIVCVCSCKKKDANTSQPVDDIVYVDYASLKPGNYWVYEQYKIDSAGGAANAQGVFDSCYVEKDTTINAQTYHKYMAPDQSGTGYTPSYLRDSLSYIMDNTGKIHFSSTDFTSVFASLLIFTNPDTVHVSERMGFQNVAVTVPAGTFVTSTFRTIYSFSPNYPFGPTREIDCRYAPGKGIILQTLPFYMALPSFIERRLVRYHVL